MNKLLSYCLTDTAAHRRAAHRRLWGAKKNNASVAVSLQYTVAKKEMESSTSTFICITIMLCVRRHIIHVRQMLDRFHFPFFSNMQVHHANA